jgi:hypothetical protein
LPPPWPTGMEFDASLPFVWPATGLGSAGGAAMTAAQRFARALPLALALTAVAGVWLAGAVWSFDEQTRFAASRGFSVPWLLPLVLDGLAVALAGVAYAAALDGRAAVQARFMTALAVAASALSNGAWAWSRTDGDAGAVALAMGVPVAANVAFEVLLTELRRQVHRRRGLPVAPPVPLPRLSRIALAPGPAFREWRAVVLDVTAPTRAAPAVAPARAVPAPAERRAITAPPPAPARRRQATRPVPADLTAVAREVAVALDKRGAAVTRAALTTGIRDRGLSVSNERAGQLLAQLRGGDTTTREGDWWEPPCGWCSRWPGSASCERWSTSGTRCSTPSWFAQRRSALPAPARSGPPAGSATPSHRSWPGRTTPARRPVQPLSERAPSG